ncbi:hypothetical protein H1230_00405 [Paenibacillus sp. 19GGS1-52]|uniref:hypothetical protein n=1 Tax=Paenibacillus sp. 19GGS1-52 TaxID=2758563 RepID=UPI001EFC1002|nr:hypothetical protein [Paenibacillus sp. 19GGS1-52]ULO07407.1 hypothetical protein H1230_00405 [Paenibacillus sp. 19GGS1-52]
MSSWLVGFIDTLANNPEEMKELAFRLVMLITMIGITFEVLVSVYFDNRKKGM